MERVVGFTIKSISDEGTYYLVNHWDKHKAFWVRREQLKPSMLFRTAGYAKRSLHKLLEIMEDYKSDKFEVEMIEL